jgi:hypothetical protein
MTLARNLATPCLGREPKAKVMTYDLLQFLRFKMSLKKLKLKTWNDRLHKGMVTHQNLVNLNLHW